MSVYESSIIDAPIEKVWSAIRDFSAIASWHPSEYNKQTNKKLLTELECHRHWSESRCLSNSVQLIQTDAGLSSSEIENGQPDNQIGVVRKLTTKDGGIIRERLLALDDQNHLVTYTILDSTDFKDYVATLR